MIKKKSKGFTLAELLMTSVLLTVLALAVYATLASGIKIWQKAKLAVPEEDAVVFLDKFTSDLKNSFKFNTVSFTGKKDAFEFATLVTSLRLNCRTVGKVTYFYNSFSKEIKRVEKDYSHIYSNEEASARPMLGSVDYTKIQYYKYNKVMKEYVWLDEWQEETELPVAVRLEFGLINGDKITKFTKTVSLPINS